MIFFLDNCFCLNKFNGGKIRKFVKLSFSLDYSKRWNTEQPKLKLRQNLKFRPFGIQTEIRAINPNGFSSNALKQTGLHARSVERPFDFQMSRDPTEVNCPKLKLVRISDVNCLYFKI